MITLHGGCFTGGSASWDKEQTACLEKEGLTVHQLDFPKDNLEHTIEYLIRYLSSFDTPPHILGRSSGGYLAKIIHDKYPHLIDKAIYLSPVFNPVVRARHNPQFKERQDSYFRYLMRSNKSNEQSTEAEYLIPNTDTFNPSTELLLLASHDENVPVECFTEEQLDAADSLGIRTHKGMTTTCSLKFQQVLNDFL